jgi:hypothetical protein
MNKEFHYSIVKVLAEKAGLSPEDSQIVAYASQFVDDAAIDNRFFLKNFPTNQEFNELYNNGIFFPIQTGHAGVTYVNALEPAVQRSVWAAFHFLPAQEFTSALKANFRTQANGELAGLLVDRAIEEVVSSDISNRTRRLIKLGIALHSYADTWSHDDFYGISYGKNKKKESQVLTEGGWQEDPPFFWVGIGHALCNSADAPNVTWRYKNETDEEFVEKNNTSRFLEAAKQIYGKLRQITNTGVPFSSFKGNIENCLKFGHVDASFPEVHLSYSNEEWVKAGRKLLLRETRKSSSYWVYEHKGDMKWYYFQLEALAQRKFILERIAQ